MSANLTPLKGRFSRFKLNKQEEYLMAIPEDRDGDIKMTMGGKREHTTTLPLEEFEKLTGHYIVGLEPEFDYDLDFVLAQYKAMMEKNDLAVDETSKYSLMQGSVTFTTNTNTEVICQSYLQEIGDKYKVVISRDAGWRTKESKEFTGPKSSLPLLLENAIKTIEKFSTTKVQVTSKELSEEEKVRQYDEHGFPKLLGNESVKDYFESQNMPAGIVINNEGKFQPFVSNQYPGYEKRDFHETNSYKTLRGAEKFLDQYDFDKLGRYKDTITQEAFSESFHEYKRHQLHSISSWSDKTLGNIELEHGHGEISLLQKEQSEETGTHYYVNMNFIDEKTGQSIDNKFYLRLPEKHPAYQVGNAYNDFSSDISQGYKNGTIEFNEDTRTKEEKLEYHKERFFIFKESVERSEKSISESTDGPGYRKAWKSHMDKNISCRDHHQEQYVALSIELYSEDESSLAL